MLACVLCGLVLGFMGLGVGIGAAEEASPPAGARRTVDATWTRTIEVEGRALIVRDDLPGARVAALGHALRAAVEQVAGVYVSSSLLTRNAITVEDTVRLRAAGFARLDQVLDEDARDGVYRVKARVVVYLKRLLEQMRAEGLGRQYRVLVALPNPYVKGNDGALATTTLIEDELCRALRYAGFFLVDWRSQAAKYGDAAGPPPTGAGPDRIAAWGRAYGADLVIRGWVAPPAALPTLITPDWTGIDYVRLRIDLVAQAVRTDTVEVLGSQSLSQALEGVGRVRTVRSGLLTLSRRLCDRMVAQLLALPGAPSTTVLISVAGLQSAMDAQLLQEALASAPAVRGVTHRTLDGDTLRVELLVAADCADRMPAILEDVQSVSDFHLQVDSATGGCIRARVIAVP